MFAPSPVPTLSFRAQRGICFSLRSALPQILLLSELRIPPRPPCKSFPFRTLRDSARLRVLSVSALSCSLSRLSLHPYFLTSSTPHTPPLTHSTFPEPATPSSLL